MSISKDKKYQADIINKLYNILDLQNNSTSSTRTSTKKTK